MAKTAPPQRRPANLTTEQMKNAIAPLRRRIAEVEVFSPQTVSDRRDPRIGALQRALEGTLADIFGADTLEFRRNRVICELDTARHNMRGVPSGEVIEGLFRGRERAILGLNEIIKSFQEKLDDSGETEAGRAQRVLGDLQLHPEIARRVNRLFRDGHYANAVEDACKALIALVKLRSGRDDLDGATLMQEVFSVKNPVLSFNDLRDESDRSEQLRYDAPCLPARYWLSEIRERTSSSRTTQTGRSRQSRR
jgi:hypothetical protein